MSEVPMSREAMLAGLQDIRLPPEAAGGAAAELAVAVGMAALAGFVVVAAMRALSRPRRPVRPPTLAARIAALEALSDDARRVALLHLLKEVAPDRHLALGGKLYRPQGLSLTQIEAEVARLA